MSMDRLQQHCSYPHSPICYLLGTPAHKETQSWATVIPGGTPLTWEVVPDSHLFPVLSSRRLWKAVQEAAKHCSLLHTPTLEFFFAGRNILNIANRNDKDSETGEEQQSVHCRQSLKRKYLWAKFKPGVNRSQSSNNRGISPHSH